MHPYLGEWIRPLLVVHVLAAFTFVLVHGPSIAAMMRLRTERDLGAVRALLDMSRTWSGLSWSAWGVLVLSGAGLAAAEHLWRAPWVWGSAVVLVLVSGIMSPLAAHAFNHAREAAGLPWFDGKGVRAPVPVDPALLEVALGRIRARAAATMALGAIGLLVLVYLMVAKPG